MYYPRKIVYLKLIREFLYTLVKRRRTSREEDSSLGFKSRSLAQRTNALPTVLFCQLSQLFCQLIVFPAVGRQLVPCIITQFLTLD